MEEIKIDITNANLFESLLDINYSELSHYDIHNDFNLKSLDYDEGSVFIMCFNSVNDRNTTLKIVFKAPKFIDFNIMLDDKDKLTIDNFHRGRFEYKGNLFDEYEGKKCFYIEFYSEGSIVILASRVFLKVCKETKIIDLKKK